MPDGIRTVIGFDFGSQSIGVAVGQTLTSMATPLDAVKTNDWDKIEKLLQEWKPQQLIVGLPLNMKGEQQTMTARARRFGRQLQGRYGIETTLIDERLTTREAYQMAIEAKRKKSKAEIDSLSALLITESWLRDYD